MGALGGQPKALLASWGCNPPTFSLPFLAPLPNPCHGLRPSCPRDVQGENTQGEGLGALIAHGWAPPHGGGGTQLIHLLLRTLLGLAPSQGLCKKQR